MSSLGVPGSGMDVGPRPYFGELASAPTKF
jgi:hypothetical protein